MSGKKQIQITVVYHVTEEVPDDWDEGNIAFYVEENHCHDNYVTAMAREIDADPSHCKTCHRSVAFVGHIPLEVFSNAVRTETPKGPCAECARALGDPIYFCREHGTNVGPLGEKRTNEVPPIASGDDVPYGHCRCECAPCLHGQHCHVAYCKSEHVTRSQDTTPRSDGRAPTLAAIIRRVERKFEVSDAVNHPQHYNSHPSGIECIDVVEHLTFNVGNAIKYLWRAGLKDAAIQDLKKARWYIDREIQRLEKGVAQ